MRIQWFQILNIFVMLLVTIVTLFPFIHMIAVSLSGDDYVLRGEIFLWPKGINLDMYKIVLQDARILTAYVNTISYTVVGTLASLIITSLGAYALAKSHLIFRKFFMFLIIFTMFFTGGMIPTFLTVKELGLLDSFWAMVLPGAVSTWNLIIMRTFFMGIPKELEESGKIDGLSDFGIFLRIVLPLSKAVMATIGLFYAVGIWNNFYQALLYLRSSELYPLQVVLRNIVIAGQANEVNSGIGDQLVVEESLKFATIIAATLPILLVYPFLQKYFVKGVMIGGVKG